MAYKVLGQTLATAAATPTTYNLVGDPSFETCTVGDATSLYSATTSTWTALAGTKGWYWNTNTPGSYATFTAAVNASSTNLDTTANYNGGLLAKNGTNAILIAAQTYSYGITYMWLRYGLVPGGVATTVNSTNFLVGPQGSAYAAIPVTGSTTYYLSADYYQNYSGGTSYQCYVIWFDSVGTFIQADQMVLNLGASQTSTWTRVSASTTSPSNAAFAGIQLAFPINILSATGYTKYAAGLDGICFSTVSGTTTTFPDPYLGGTDNTFVSPFTARKQYNWASTANNSNTVSSTAGAATTLYTVPTGKSSVVSTLTASNNTTSTQKYRIAVQPSADAALSLKHYILFDGTLPANSTTSLTLGITLAAGDKLIVSADSANLSFSAFGSEA